MPVNSLLVWGGRSLWWGPGCSLCGVVLEDLGEPLDEPPANFDLSFDS